MVKLAEIAATSMPEPTKAFFMHLQKREGIE